MKRFPIFLAAWLAACGEPMPEPERTLTITAAPAELFVNNGTRPSSILRAFLVTDDVPVRVLPTRWVVVDPGFGIIDDEGRFIASGRPSDATKSPATTSCPSSTANASTVGEPPQAPSKPSPIGDQAAPSQIAAPPAGMPPAARNDPPTSRRPSSR